jgi:transcriptional regulator with XRE-family HTH domain
MKKSVWHKKYKTLSLELLNLRKDAGLTQIQLAEKLDKPQSYISKYESGDRYLDFIEVLAVCEACNADPIQLIQKLNVSFPK